MNIQQTLLEAQDLLEQADIDSYKLDAELLLFHVLNIDKTEYFRNPERSLDNQEHSKFSEFIQQRITRKPVSKIIGLKEFYSLDFHTNNHTLDPRPDTELLIDTARKLLNINDKLSILELGTGTGCIIITLLKYFNVSRGTSVDISQEALNVAQENATLHNIENRLELQKGDMLKGLTNQYDLIISNPPYIEESEIGRLEPEVRTHDPMMALEGGGDGLDFYKIIANNARQHLTIKGIIILEIGYNQKQAVTSIFAEAGFKLRESLKDLGNNDRCLVFH